MFIATLLSVALFTVALVLGTAMEDIMGLLAGGQLTGSTFVYLLLRLIPVVVPNALPLGILTAVLIVLGRMSANNEILAMKAAGVSLYRIVAPIALLAILGTGLAMVIALYYTPKAKRNYQTLLANIVKEEPLKFLQPKTFIHQFPGLVIYGHERRATEMRNIYIWELSDDHQVTAFIRAERGIAHFDKATHTIQLRLIRGMAETRSSNDAENFVENAIPTGRFAEGELSLSLKKILGNPSAATKLSSMTLNELLAERNRLLHAQPDTEAEQRENDNRRIITQLAIQENLARSCAVISLCLIAFPLGIKVSRSETYANIAVAIALALVYYVFFIMVTWLEKTPHLRPDIFIWLPNIVFQAVGLWALRRANNDGLGGGGKGTAIPRLRAFLGRR